MPAIRIQVGAALNANVNQLFQPFVAAAAKARATVARDMGRGAKDADKEWRELEKTARGIEREFKKEAAEAARAQARAAKEADRSWKQFTSNAAANFRGFVGGAARIGGSLLRGAGVNFDLASNVSTALGNQDLAAMLSKKGFQEGAMGAAGVKQDPSKLLDEAGKAADATAKSTKDMLESMTAFTESSGDLAMARDMITEIGKVSNATGAELSTMATIAGKLDLKMQDSVKDAGERKKIIGDTLRVFAAQGKTGAIDIEQLAPQIPKMIAAAGRLGMDPTKAFQTAGIVAQISAASGGSSSPAIAARSVGALIEAMGKTQTGFLGGKQGAKTGISIPTFEDAGHTKLRNPLEVVAEAVSATKGDLSKMAQLIPNIRGNALGVGLQGIYTKAGGGAKGEEAMRQAIAKYTAAVMSQEEVERENADRLKATTAKAQLFQNQLERVAGSLADRVLPQVEKMQGTFLGIVKVGADLMGFLAENPGKAIVLAITASIAKAAIGQAVSTGLLSLMMKSTNGGAPGGGPIAKAGFLSKLGTALTIATAAVTIASVGMMAIDSVMKSKEEAKDKFDAGTVDVENSLRAARMASKEPGKFGFTKEQETAVQAKQAELEQRIGAAQDPTGFFSALKGSLFGGKGFGARSNEQQDAAHIEELKAELSQLKAVMDSIKSGTLKVTVTNMPAGAPPGTSGTPPPTGG